MSNEYVQVTMTRADLEAYQALRREHAVPNVVGQPMPEAEGDRAFGEPFKANPPTTRRLPSPQDWVDKQLNNMAAVGEQNYRVGIANPKRDWQTSAIAGQGAYEAKMRDANVLKRRETAIRSVSSDEWAAQAERGASRLVQGTMDRRPKIERKVQALHSKMGTIVQRIDAMPNTTAADREARMIANVRAMREIKGTI